MSDDKDLLIKKVTSFCNELEKKRDLSFREAASFREALILNLFFNIIEKKPSLNLDTIDKVIERSNKSLKKRIISWYNSVKQTATLEG